MAKAKKISSTEDNEEEKKKPVSVTEEFEETAEDTAILEIEAMLADTSLNGAKVRISRRAPGDDEFFHCATIPVSAFDLDQVRNQYGGGYYQITLLNSSGKYVKRSSFGIDPRIKGKLDGGSNDPASPAPADNSALLLQEISKSKDESFKMMMLMMQESNKSLATVMAAAMGRPQAGGGGLDLKDVIAFLPLLQQKKAEGMSPSDMLAFFKEVRELSQGEEKTGGILETVKEFIPMLGPIFGRMNQGAAQIPEIEARRVEPIAPTGGPGPRQNPPRPAQEPKPESDLLRVLNLSLAGARKNSDVGLYVDLFFDNVQDSERDQIKNVLTQEDWFGLFFPNLPDAATVKPWMQQLRDMILESLQAEEKNENDSHAANPGGGDSAVVQHPNGAGGAV